MRSSEETHRAELCDFALGQALARALACLGAFGALAQRAATCVLWLARLALARGALAKVLLLAVVAHFVLVAFLVAAHHFARAALVCVFTLHTGRQCLGFVEKQEGVSEAQRKIRRCRRDSDGGRDKPCKCSIRRGAGVRIRCTSRGRRGPRLSAAAWQTW